MTRNRLLCEGSLSPDGLRDNGVRQRDCERAARYDGRHEAMCGSVLFRLNTKWAPKIGLGAGGPPENVPLAVQSIIDCQLIVR